MSVDSIHAWEYARRGYVVINVNMYGAGTSDMPDYFEDGKPYNRNQGTSGLYDALQYARSISYVDPTRIGMWGHSQAYSIIGSVLVLDGELLSLNDRMFNALHDEFGVEITAEQLSLNADDVAVEVLPAEQMKTYDYIKAEQQEIVNNYVKAARVMDNNCCYVKTTVAGIEVERSVHTNLQIGGERNGTSPTSATRFTKPNERYMKIFCVDGPYNPPTHHNGNLWSPAAISRTMEFFTQALGYNNGNLADSSTQPISCTKLFSGYLALIFSTLATLSLLGFLGALAGILLSTKTFAACEAAAYKPRLKVKSKDFAIVTVIAAVTSFVGAYFGSRETLGLKASNAIMSKFLPTEPGHTRLLFMIMATALCGTLLFGIFTLFTRRKSGNSDPAVAKLSELNIKMNFKIVLKTFGLCLVLFAAAYALVAFVAGAFDGRFQFVDGSLELMKTYSFMRMFKYALILLPFTFVISILNNLTIVDGVSDGMDTAISVVVNSIGTWAFIIIAYILTFSTPDHMTALGLHTMLPAICLVPMCNYLYRKLYKSTGSIWASAFFVALLLGWRLSAYISHRFMFWGYDSVITRFFGL